MDVVAEVRAVTRKEADVVATIEAVAKRREAEVVVANAENAVKTTVIHVDAAKMTQAQALKKA